MTIAQFQQPGYVQVGSGNQRQDVPIITDTFQGNMPQQTHERFLRDLIVHLLKLQQDNNMSEIQMYLHNDIQSLDLYKFLRPI